MAITRRCVVACTFLAVLSLLPETGYGIRCYQCNSTSNNNLFQCNEFLTNDMDLYPESCDNVYGAQYCVKHIGRFEGRYVTEKKSTFDIKDHVVLPFFECISDSVHHCLNKIGLRPVYSISKKLNMLMEKGKDKIDHMKTTGIVYKLKCQDCDASYIGQTKRQLCTRVKEHKNNKKTGHEPFCSMTLDCYQCTSADEWKCMDSELVRNFLLPTNCNHVYGARFCIKSIGRYGGGIGTKRFCSSVHMGNYCDYVKQPGDKLTYRTCVFTCSEDGCNSATSFVPDAMYTWIMPGLVVAWKKLFHR